MQKFHKIFLHILLFQNILSIFLFWEKTGIFKLPAPCDPPPPKKKKNLSDVFAKNAIILRAPLRLIYFSYKMLPAWSS